MPRGDRDIVLFETGRDGYGFARGGERDTYHWTAGFDCRSGQAVPAAAYTRVLAQNSFSKIACLFEWENATSQPLLIWTGGDGTGEAIIYQWVNGGVTATAHPVASLQPAFTSGVLFRHDQNPTADPDEEMAWFSNGFGNDILVRRKKDGTIDTGSTTTHTAKADLLAVVGANLYRTIGYKIGKLTLNTDPGITGNWPVQTASVPAGRPTYPINAVLPLGGSPVVLKGDGVFLYNAAPSTAAFDSRLYTSPHPDNGKGGYTDGRSRIYYPTVAGYVIVITFGFQNSQTPTKETQFSRDTPFGRIGAMHADLDHVYAAIDPGFVRTQDGIGLVVKKQIGGAITTDTANLTDRNYNTTAAWNTLVSGNFIWLGADEPTMGFYVELNSARGSTTTASALTAAYGLADGSYRSVTLMDSTMCFIQEGLISFHDSRVHPYRSVGNEWTKTTVDGVSKYWLRITVNSTLTGVTPREVYAVPYRPPIDPDRNAITGYALASAVPKVLVGTWQGERLVWDDVWTLWAPRIEQLVVGRVNDAVTDSALALYAVTGDGLYAMPVGPDGNPARAAYPNLGDADSFAAGVGDHVLVLTGNDFGLPANPKEVKGVLIHGEGLQGDDALYVYWRWDNADRWERQGPYPDPTFPIYVPLTKSGRVLDLALSFDDGSRTAFAPQISRILVPEGDWSWQEAASAVGQGVDVASPQAV